MEQLDSLAFEISRNNLSILLQRARLSDDDSGLAVSLAGEKLIITATGGDVRAQAEAAIRIVRNPQAPGIRHWEVHPDLFRRLLVSRTPQDVFRDPIEIAIPLSTPETAANDVIAKIQAGDLHLTWPFSEKAEVEILARPATQSALVVNGPVIADAIRRCRPYVDLKHSLLGAIHIKDHVACGAQNVAARWIEAADLGNLNMALKRADAGYVAYALSHFSARSNLLCVDEHGWVWDDGAILRFPITAANSLESVVQNVPESARVHAGEFMSALRKVAAQRKGSEKYLTLRFFGGSPSGRAVISTPVVGGEATATCKLDIVAGGKLDGPDAYVEMQLLVDHIKPLGASPGGIISLSFPKTGILFEEQHSTLKIATHVANKKLEFKSIIERWNHDSAHSL